MTQWKSILHGDATGWLLEESNPFVRYFTLRWLLDKPEGDPEVVAASRAIADSTPVRKILRHQRPEGYWGSDPRPHHGTSGRLLLLRWLGYKGNGEVRKAMDYRLDGCLLENGAYGLEMKGRTMLLPCHGADLLGLMLWYGYADDPRARQLLNWILDLQDPDGAWPCVSKVKPFPCLWATAVVLRALGDLPSGWITPYIEHSRSRAVELFLDSGLTKHPKARTKPSPRWLLFGFPLQFDTDILEVLNLLAPHVSPCDARIQGGLRTVLERQDEVGRWPCEKHPKGGMWMHKFVPAEEIGRPSKWVTLHALKMLKTLHSNTG